MPARLEHDGAPKMIVTVARVVSLREDRCADKVGIAILDDADGSPAVCISTTLMVVGLACSVMMVPGVVDSAIWNNATRCFIRQPSPQNGD
ncbi:hypothetical protein [Sphingopyxis panaciterrae]